jgi:hypothetical protein
LPAGAADAGGFLGAAIAATGRFAVAGFARCAGPFRVVLAAGFFAVDRRAGAGLAAFRLAGFFTDKAFLPADGFFFAEVFGFGAGFPFDAAFFFLAMSSTPARRDVTW